MSRILCFDWYIASHIYVVIGSGNCLPPVGYQAIAGASDLVFASGPPGANFSEIYRKIHFQSLIPFENVGKMSVTFFRPQHVKPINFIIIGRESRKFGRWYQCSLSFCSWAAATPVKYESDSNNLLLQHRNFSYGEINEQSFSNPHPRTCHLLGVKIIFEPLMAYFHLNPLSGTHFSEIWIKIPKFPHNKMSLKIFPAKYRSIHSGLTALIAK